ncbi:MAG: right-handed parallel beta-helix repeat-containing protein [Fimbriimonadaceae bacterium]
MTLALTLLCLGFQATGDVRVGDTESLARAMRNAKPGTRILIEPGTYRGGISASIHGAKDKPIVIRAADPKNPPRIVGGGTGIHLSDSSYVEISDLIIEKATNNGINIDDGGTYETPSHHIKLHNLQVRDLPPGNNDGIKLSGVTDSQVISCLVERWGGSGVDMVGCSKVDIIDSTFRSGGDSGVQAKGGSSDINIRRCRFEDYGQRGVNAGGSTGMQFFRWFPKAPADGQKFEAKNVRIADCTFIGGVAPLAFVGVDGALAEYNTILNPGRWAIRILQETRDAGFVPSRGVRFERNLVVFSSGRWSEGGVNIGPGTAPLTFTFKENFWFCTDAPSSSRPKLPTPEVGGIYGNDPMLTADFRVPKGSPAVGYGSRIGKPAR